MRLLSIALVLPYLSTINAWDSDLFPAVYEAVLQDNIAYINSNNAVKEGLEHIQNAVTVDLAKTVTCLDTLTATKGEECYAMASNYVASRTKTVAVFLEQRFRNLFIPGYAKRTLGMMLFDASFGYLGDLGFHERNQEVILECAKRQCTSESQPIATELGKIAQNFHVLTGPKLAGRHYDLKWNVMIDTYNQHKLTDSPADNYNMWMPGELTTIATTWPATQTFHQFNFNTSMMEVADEELDSWFTAAKFSILHHFHYYFLFGPDRIFATAASNKPLAEFLKRAEAMLGPDLMESLDRREQFMDSISTRARFSRGETMTSMGHFQVRLHHAGKLYMLEDVLTRTRRLLRSWLEGPLGSGAMAAWYIWGTSRRMRVLRI